MTRLHPLDGLHAAVRGAGAPVVALHDAASSGAQWRSLAGYIEAHYRIWTPDLPGWGASAPAHGASGEARAIQRLIERIGRPVHLVGHGTGGALALRLAAERPEAVRSLTVIGPSAFCLLRSGGIADRHLFQDVVGLATAMAAAIAAGGREHAMRRYVDYGLGAGAWQRTSAPERARLLAGLERLMVELGMLTAEPAWRAPLAAIRCPTLVLVGEEAPLPSLRISALVAGTVPQATLRLIPDAGHLVPLTDPHLIDPAIGAHLRAADREAVLAAVLAAA